MTTTNTLYYWDVTARVEWTIHVGDLQRTVTAEGKQRTYARADHRPVAIDLIMSGLPT